MFNYQINHPKKTGRIKMENHSNHLILAKINILMLWATQAVWMFYLLTSALEVKNNLQI